jgi:hypothetical protein
VLPGYVRAELAGLPAEELEEILVRFREREREYSHVGPVTISDGMSHP